MGFEDFDQHMPCAVGFCFPRLIIFPFPVALVFDMFVTSRVVTIGFSFVHFA
ncbi:MAG: hypothetical protein RBR08_02985 [Desulforegulaceae bacterium]|nr:hypothetical protein [Desulforegulaceae bacterium]